MHIKSRHIVFLAAAIQAAAAFGSGPVMGERRELVGKRSLNAKQYRNSDGSRTLEAHCGHIHYLSDEGRFEPIDTRLIVIGDKWDMRKAGYQVELPARADEWFHFVNATRVDPNAAAQDRSAAQISAAPEWVDLRPLAVQAAPGMLVQEGDWAGKTVRYADAYGPGMDLEFIATNTEFRKEVVARQRPADLSQDLSFSFELRFSGDADIRIVEDAEQRAWSGREVTLEAPDQLVVGRLRDTWFRKFRLWDSAGNQGRVRIKLEKRNGSVVLTKILDRKFLTDAVYPVRTDTTTSYYTGAGDGYCTYGGAPGESSTDWNTIHDNTAGGDYSTYTAINVSARIRRDGSNLWNIYRGFIPVDTSAIPDDNVIDSAAWHFFASNGGNSSGGAEAAIVTGTTQESTSYLVKADYDNCGMVNNPTEGSARIAQGAWTNSVYNVIPLNATGIASINKTGFTRHGWRNGDDMDDTPPSTSIPPDFNDFLEFYSSEETGTSRDPYLEVTYHEPNNAPTNFSLLEPAGGSTVCGGRPTFVWEESFDTDGPDALTYRLELSEDAGFTEPIYRSVPNLTSPSFTPDVGDEIAGGTYYWRVVATDGVLETTSGATFDLIVDDADTDSDGLPDCADGCSNDAAKTAPEICGCGVAETDTDADGTPDCNDVDRLLHFQGKLRDAAGATISGTRDITFHLYDAASGGSLLFAESHAAVQVTSGLFSSLIGDQTTGGVPDAAIEKTDIYIAVSVDSGAELAPRSRVPAGPYAIKAKSAEQLVAPGTLNPAMVVDANGQVGVGTDTPQYPLEMASGAHVTSGGEWVDASSRALKHDIASLPAERAAQTLEGLEPVTFRYNAQPNETQVGFIAEDVPALVATADRTGVSPMDVVAVLTRVVKEQQETIRRMQEEHDRQEQRISDLECRIAPH